MIPIREAFAAYDAHVRPLPVEEVAIAEAAGRVLRAEARSATDLPPFSQSAMDGYALRAADSAHATPDAPARLPLVGVVAAGRLDPVPTLPPGAALRIYTGAHLPHGADAVIRQEDVRVEDGTLLLSAPVSPAQDVRHRGEEVRAGDLVLGAHVRVTPGTVGALSMAGIATVAVTRRVRVRLITTGDEVVAAGAALAPGQIHDANQVLLRAALAADPAVALDHEHLDDALEPTIAALERARREVDLVITTGGVSVGDRDHVPAAARAAGFEARFWKVAQAPGKPLLFSTAPGTLLLGLPGNPAAVFCGLHTHVARVLDLLLGLPAPRPTLSTGVLTRAARRMPTRDRWLRCTRSTDAQGVLRLDPLPGQDSHMLGNLAACDTIAWLGAGPDDAPAGERLAWFPVG